PESVYVALVEEGEGDGDASAKAVFDDDAVGEPVGRTGEGAVVRSIPVTATSSETTTVCASAKVSAPGQKIGSDPSVATDT
ncbi:hypothetical protein ACTUM2_14905, partial [Listeria monocytogenes]|uniref:hypothetical protein n=1 Tax=Listeria monocytogenes TaxID=1639 RepID=UPI003FA4AAC6